MKRLSILLAASTFAAAIGCSGGGTGGKPAIDPKTGSAITDSKGNAVSVAAANKYKDGLAFFAKHDKANDWTKESCEQAAKTFLDAADEQDKKFLEAIYNAGVSWQRCNDDKKAKEYFQEVLKADPKFHRARVQIAIYDFAESGEKDLDKAISELTQAAIVDARFQNVEGLVQLGMLHMKRNNTSPDKDGRTDMQNAKRLAQSALAIDDGYLPAFNLLALLYMEAAKIKAGRSSSRKAVATNASKQKKADTQALDLAALVCSQAIRKNPNYAPIHNTAGMIQVELSNLNSAVSSFNRARTLDPTFYEAQMNYAAVNLQFRGFAQAEEAYRGVLKMRPNDYDARLGLALALRGQIDDSNFDKYVAAASSEIEQAKRIAPDRAETYYNDAILTQEYKAKSGGPDGEKMMLKAKDLFSQFIAKAGSAPEYADAVKRSKERMEEIQQIIDFNKQTEADRKAMEAEAKQRAAEAEAGVSSDGN